MKSSSVMTCAGAVLAVAIGAVVSVARSDAESMAASPIYGVTIPDGYRQWELVAPALEGKPLNELRAVVGNRTAIDAHRAGSLPFPDGTMLVKLAWKHIQSPEFESALVRGFATTVQVMVKDSKRCAATGGWGFGRFSDGQPADEAQHQTCFVCHKAQVKARDYVFTKFAP
jgi:hypothetical protein